MTVRTIAASLLLGAGVLVCASTADARGARGAVAVGPRGGVAGRGGVIGPLGAAGGAFARGPFGAAAARGGVIGPFGAAGGAFARAPFGAVAARGAVAGFGGFRPYGSFAAGAAGFRGFAPFYRPYGTFAAGAAGFRAYAPFWGGYRGWGYPGVWGGYRPYWGYPVARFGVGYGLGLGYGYGGYGGYGYGAYPYYGTTVGYPYYNNYYPCVVDQTIVTNPSATYLSTDPSAQVQQPVLTTPGAAAPPTDGTYPYDGGPQVPVPTPGAAPAPATPAPTTTPVPSAPLEGRTVSLPKPASKWTFPAYGQKARRTTAPADDTLLTRGTPAKSAAR